MSKDPPNRRAGGPIVERPPIAANRVQPQLEALAARKASLDHLDAEVAACVQAAQELRAIEPLLAEHDHALEVGLYQIASLTQLQLTPITCVSASDPAAWTTLTPVPAPPTLAAAAGLLTAGGIGDRLDALERWVGSLVTLSGPLQAMVDQFESHHHPFQWQWRPSERATPPMYMAVSNPGTTGTTGAALPPIDLFAPLPSPGFPRTGESIEARMSHLADDLGKVRDAYRRFSTVARGFADHRHHLRLGISMFTQTSGMLYTVASTPAQLARTGR